MTRLLSTDQDSETGRYCPSCNADWRAGEIPRDAVEKGYYGHRAPCEKRREWDDDWDPSVPCTCPPRHYSHLVGVVQRGADCVGVWLCRMCGTRWDRWTGEELS